MRNPNESQATPSIDMFELNSRYKKEAQYGFFGWFKHATARYRSTKGRARRKEFWWFILGCTLINILAGYAGYLIFGVGGGYSHILLNLAVNLLQLYPVFLVVNLILLYPIFTVGVRRLHDTGRSGWWWSLWVVPSILMACTKAVGNHFSLEGGTFGLWLESSQTSTTILSLLWVFIISGWFLNTVFMLRGTSDKMNKYGAPAKRVGKRVPIKEADEKTKPA